MAKKAKSKGAAPAPARAAGGPSGLDRLIGRLTTLVAGLFVVSLVLDAAG